jgi:hypothetical protein
LTGELRPGAAGQFQPRTVIPLVAHRW